MLLRVHFQNNNNNKKNKQNSSKANMQFWDLQSQPMVIKTMYKNLKFMLLIPKLEYKPNLW